MAWWVCFSHSPCLPQELHSLFGDLLGTTLDGPQLFDELNLFPLGTMLVFLRLSEQMGFVWDNRVQTTLLDTK